MSNANVGWMFYKETFVHLNQNSQKLDNSTVKQVNKKILDAFPIKYDYPNGSCHAIELKTLYPGLLVGTGYSHDAKGDENFKMGFFFDHTTGMPIIPASSIKGVLRSKFKMLDIAEKTEAVLSEFCYFYQELGLDNPKKEDLEALEKETFEGKGAKSMYHRDIFYDAYPIKAQDKNRLFYDDTLAHHASEFEDPNPIRFLKVAGEVVYKFSFDLHDGVLTAAKKEELFLLMLQSSGVGAKTNVGYGQFEELSKDEARNIESKRESDAETPTSRILKENKITDIVGNYEQGFEARVAGFLGDLKKELIILLNKELQNANSKQKSKIEQRIKKVQEW